MLGIPRDITKLNTVQPEIVIIKVSSVKNNPGEAEVIVRCKNNKEIVMVFPDLECVEACDIVIVYFSCHGFINNENREFYLVPYDTGKGHSGKITTDLIGNAISSRLLSYWLKKIDSENIALIIDSCYSGGFIGKAGNREL